MNMTTNLDNIPLKTNKNNDVINDDSDDPMVKDILNEFQQEFELNTRKTVPNNNYQVNMQPPAQDIQQEKPPMPAPRKRINSNNNNNQISYYNQIYINKSIIITILFALICSPLIFPIIIQKLPSSMVDIAQEYSLYIKLGLVFICVYLLYFYNYL